MLNALRVLQVEDADAVCDDVLDELGACVSALELVNKSVRECLVKVHLVRHTVCASLAAGEGSIAAARPHSGAFTERTSIVSLLLLNAGDYAQAQYLARVQSAYLARVGVTTLQHIIQLRLSDILGDVGVKFWSFRAALEDAYHRGARAVFLYVVLV